MRAVRRLRYSNRYVRTRQRWLNSNASTPSPSVSAGSSDYVKQMPSLETELPGMPQLMRGENLAEPETKITTLENGITVASQEDYGQVSSVGVFVNAGSRLETKSNNGVSYIIEKMAFRSTKNRTGQEIMQKLEEIGGNSLTTGSREHIVFQIEFLRSELDQGLDLLADNILCPLFLENELAEVKDMISFEQMDLQYEPTLLMHEWVHEAAFGKETPLGQPLMVSGAELDAVSSTEMHSFVKDHFVGSNIVISAAGVDHDELVYYASKKFQSVPSTTAASRAVAEKNEKYAYVGGEVRIEEEPPQQAVSETFVEPPPPMTHVMIAFGMNGWNDEDLVPICVLNTLLGGGSSFSAGGPGKGMYTRLYREVLNYNAWCEHATAQTVMLENHGVLGIVGSAEPQYSFTLVKTIVQQLYNIGVQLATEEETSRARNQLKSRVLMNLEQRNVLCEDIGRQLLCYQMRESVPSLCRRIDNVTREDLLRVARKMLSTRPSMVSYGKDLSNTPSYTEVENFFAVFRDDDTQNA